MTGKARWHVVEFEPGSTQIKRIWKWDDWITTHTISRPKDDAVMMIGAEDELDAYVKAMRGEGLQY